MGIILDSVCGFLGSSPDVALCTPTMVFFALVCVGFIFGLTIGWAWKPKWATFPGQTQQPPLLCSSPHKLIDSSPPSSPSRSAVSPLKGFGSAPCLTSLMLTSPNLGCYLNPTVPNSQFDDSCGTSSQLNNEEKSHAADLVREEDLEYLHQLVETKDGGPDWIKMMDRSTPGMTYQAWRRDAKNGPPQYRTRTVFEDASPEIVRDFFWDDEFRPHWDDMLAFAATLDECLITGSMVVHWLRKFPFFCSDREYTIGRRIWESGRSYYCVTKGVPYPSVPRHDKPRRVDLFYSSWFIRAVESRRGDGQLTACEVLLFHYEDMGIPWEISKLGVRQGMWASVKKIELGLLAYQTARASGAAPSRPAFMAGISTKVNPEGFPENTKESSESEAGSSSVESSGRNISKVLIIGAAVALACSIDQGLLGKACIFGISRWLGNLRKRSVS